MLTISVIKADVGGYVGHSASHPDVLDASTFPASVEGWVRGPHQGPWMPCSVKDNQQSTSLRRCRRPAAGLRKRKKEWLSDCSEGTVHRRRCVQSRQPQKKVFVIMPFSLRQVYDAITEVAHELGLLVERADEIAHNEILLDVVLDRIETSDVVVAVTAGHNPNVMYEVSYAHAAGTPTILVTPASEAAAIPFVLRGVNHVLYESQADLRWQLVKRLRATV